MTPLNICCINNCTSENLCFCTKCSVDVNFQTLDFLSFLTRFNYNNSAQSSVRFISLFLNLVKHFFCNLQILFDLI